MKIYHNPSCSKSCAALEFLKENGFNPKIINYLEEIPDKEELKELLQLLKITPIHLIRTKEPLFQQNYKHLSLTQEQWLDIMIQNPILIERPIIINEGKAVIGRPKEQILTLFNK